MYTICIYYIMPRFNFYIQNFYHVTYLCIIQYIIYLLGLHVLHIKNIV